MKKLFKLSAFAAALLTSSAYASTITIDADLDGNATNGTTVSDMVSSTFNATSYYVDENADGFVGDGEFVFDLGLGVDIAGFSPAGLPAGYLTDWKFQADYLIYGNAIVTNTDLSPFGGILGSDDDIYNDFGETSLGPLTFSNETLAANILDGLLNLFIVDLDGTGNVETGTKTLAASYSVNSLVPDMIGGQVVLDMALSGISVMEDLFYNSAGTEFQESIDDGGLWNGNLSSQFFFSDDDAPIPGQWVNADDGDDASGEKIADGSPLAYYGKNTKQVTKAANDCPDGSFGECSGLTGITPEAQAKWESVRGTIRAAGKDANGDYLDLLARSTTLGSRLTQDVPEPTSLAILALGVLGFAASRKRNIKK